MSSGCIRVSNYQPFLVEDINLLHTLGAVHSCKHVNFDGVESLRDVATTTTDHADGWTAKHTIVTEDDELCSIICMCCSASTVEPILFFVERFHALAIAVVWSGLLPIICYCAYGLVYVGMNGQLVYHHATNTQSNAAIVCKFQFFGQAFHSWFVARLHKPYSWLHSLPPKHCNHLIRPVGHEFTHMLLAKGSPDVTCSPDEIFLPHKMQSNQWTISWRFRLRGELWFWCNKL